jgi:hypothetical protein
VGKIPAGRKTTPKQEKEEKMTEFPLSASRLFAFTIDADTAQIVKLETLDASGARHELSEEEKADLARQGTEDLDQLVEQVFEAGIACVLGGGEREDKAEEPAEEAELRHMLLAPLIEHSRARRLIQREALSRAILGTLIQHAMKAPAEGENDANAGVQSERGAEARAN